MMFKQTVLACACLLAAASASAELLKVTGVGRTPIGVDAALTRTESTAAAKRDAVVALVNKLNGPRAAEDPRVQARLDELAKQLPDASINDQSTSRDAANQLVTKVTIEIEDLAVRQWLSDLGIAQTTARSFPIMIVMDEFFTTPTDSSKPLREVVEFTNDQSLRYREGASAQSASFAADSASGQATARVSASDSAGYAAESGYGREAARRDQRVNAAQSAQFRQESASGNSESASHEVAAEALNQQTFRKLVEYQPRNVGPDSNNYTLRAVLRETSKYDLAIRDADLFRSKYFRGKPLTMDELLNGGSLAQFAQAARDEQTDYLMVGNTIILDNGRSATTGQYVCDGVVSLKTYATEDAKVIAAESRSESASGNTPDQCRANVANKLGTYAVGVVGHSVNEYWKKRELYGREYVVVLKSLLGNLSDDAKDAFAEALEGMPGLAGKLVERRATRGELEMVFTYKGEAEVRRVLRKALKAEPTLAQAGTTTSGDRITVCLEGTCP